MLDKSRQYLKFTSEADINMEKSKRMDKKRTSRLSNVRGSRSKSEIRGSINQVDKSKSELRGTTASLHKKIRHAESRA